MIDEVIPCQLTVGEGENKRPVFPNTKIQCIEGLEDCLQQHSDSITEMKTTKTCVAGTGENSVVLNNGEPEQAVGKYSIVGGTDDSSLAGSLGSIGSVDKPVAYGDMSLSFGAGTKSLAAGTMAIGANTIAGCKGFYWFDINFSTKQITLSTTQTRKIPILNPNSDWNSEAAAQLSNWAVGDVISIVNKSKYVLCSTITKLDAKAGTITVDSLPFTETSTQLVPMFDDYSVICPAKPTSGIVDLGLGAFAIGLENKAVGSFSHVEGYNNSGTGDFSHVEGRDNQAGYAAHAEGNGTKAIGNRSHTEGNETEALAPNAHAEGHKSKALKQHAHAEGCATEASGNQAHAEGYLAKASGESSHAEGYSTAASAESSHAEGKETAALGSAAHSEGVYTQALGHYSHAEGNKTIAYTKNSHTEGEQTEAGTVIEDGMDENQYRGAHAEGIRTKAIRAGSHSEGIDTIANVNAQHVQGKCNIQDTEGKYAHIVGNGTSDTKRSNAHTLDWEGNAWYAGKVTAGADPTEDMDLVTLQYLNVALGDIETALDNIIAIQNKLIGGDGV